MFDLAQADKSNGDIIIAWIRWVSLYPAPERWLAPAAVGAMRALLVGVCGYFYLQVRGPAVANQRRIDSASLFTYFSRGPDPPCHKGSQSSILLGRATADPVT